MSKKPVNTKLFIAFSVLALFGGGGACYLQMQNLDYFGKKVEDLRAQLAKQGNVESELEEITQKVQLSQEKLNHLEQGVPQRAYMPTLMTEIEALGQRNGILVTGVRPMPAKFAAPAKSGDKSGEPVKKAYEEQDVEVKGNGHYLKVLAFLSELERFPKIVSVQSVTLTPKNDLNAKGDKSSLDVTVELKAFLFPTSSPASKLTQGENSHEGA